MSIDQKVEQMYKALEAMEVTEKLASVKPELRRAGTSFAVSFDFKKGTDTATAANRVSQLLANIACLKDHLKVWCDRNGKPFAGDALINSNRDVAIVHDLWNLDKHGRLKQSRSGLFPQLSHPPRSSMVFKAEAGKQPMLQIPVFGGPMQVKDGASLRVTTGVVDKDGNVLGDFENICQKAVDAWEAEFKKIGLNF